MTLSLQLSSVCWALLSQDSALSSHGCQVKLLCDRYFVLYFVKPLALKAYVGMKV